MDNIESVMTAGEWIIEKSIFHCTFDTNCLHTLLYLLLILNEYTRTTADAGVINNDGGVCKKGESSRHLLFTRNLRSNNTLWRLFGK